MAANKSYHNPGTINRGKYGNFISLKGYYDSKTKSINTRHLVALRDQLDDIIANPTEKSQDGTKDFARGLAIWINKPEDRLKREVENNFLKEEDYPDRLAEYHFDKNDPSKNGKKSFIFRELNFTIDL